MGLVNKWDKNKYLIWISDMSLFALFIFLYCVSVWSPTTFSNLLHQADTYWENDLLLTKWKTSLVNIDKENVCGKQSA